MRKVCQYFGVMVTGGLSMVLLGVGESFFRFDVITAKISVFKNKSIM
jgi:hypothetical protein